MFIDTRSAVIDAHTPFSAFGKSTRASIEPISSTRDEILPKHSSIPDLMRLFYGSISLKQIAARWGFLTRDNKERVYQPGKEDAFVFSSAKSITSFGEQARYLLQLLTTMTRTLGAGVERDDDRHIDIPAVEVGAVTGYSADAVRALSFIVGNADIMKKACIVRSVIPGWWAVSYAGKKATDMSYFLPGLTALKDLITLAATSVAFRSRYDAFWQENGDPLDTNPGYPLFSANLTKDGIPTSRNEIVTQFESVTRLARQLSGSEGVTWEGTLRAVDYLNKDDNLADHPLAIAPLRRLQPGFKWSHVFQVTAGGMRLSHDIRGFNSCRVAWMVPYLYNILISPVAILLKTTRSFLPGATHNKADKTFQNQVLARPGALLLEADYSNYDRFIPIDVIELIVGIVIDGFVKGAAERKYWKDAVMHLHNAASIISPDYGTTQSVGGWLYKPGKLGLMSGVKITSETGTLVNFVVNISALFHQGILPTQSAVNNYTSAFLRSASKDDGLVGDNNYSNARDFPLKFLVQSDDTLLIASSPEERGKMQQGFKDAVVAAGLKGTIEAGDRFLMRHTSDGGDRPVPARIWQNTLSSESPPETELIFLLGLIARTDGLFGVKDVDPFQTKDKQRLTGAEICFSLAVVESLRKFMDSAASRSTRGLQLIDGARDVGHQLMTQLTGRNGTTVQEVTQTGEWLTKVVVVKPNDFREYKQIRAELTAYLIELETKLMGKDYNANLFDRTNKYNAWILALSKDRHVPSAQTVMSYLVDADPTISAKLRTIAGKETAFFHSVCNRMNIHPLKW